MSGDDYKDSTLSFCNKLGMMGEAVGFLYQKFKSQEE